MSVQFFQCTKCKKLIGVIQPSACPTVCCGTEMRALVPNTSDGAGEKHVLVITVSGSTVSVAVGSVAHPMQDDHWIQWVALETDRGMQRKALNPGDVPTAEFALLPGEKAVAVYEFCNKHGLWKADA